MRSWVARMLQRFYPGQDKDCSLPSAGPEQNQIEGHMREVQQLVRSTASLIQRTAKENSRQAKEITERVKERTQEMDAAYQTARETADLIFNEARHRGQ
jgi:ElaB/YqjD/DUF883 family membrane-anchored ribosome-binding protein